MDTKNCYKSKECDTAMRRDVTGWCSAGFAAATQAQQPPKRNAAWLCPIQPVVFCLCTNKETHARGDAPTFE